MRSVYSPTKNPNRPIGLIRLISPIASFLIFLRINLHFQLKPTQTYSIHPKCRNFAKNSSILMSTIPQSTIFASSNRAKHQQKKDKRKKSLVFYLYI